MLRTTEVKLTNSSRPAVLLSGIGLPFLPAHLIAKNLRAMRAVLEKCEQNSKITYIKLEVYTKSTRAKRVILEISYPVLKNELLAFLRAKQPSIARD